MIFKVLDKILKMIHKNIFSILFTSTEMPAFMSHRVAFPSSNGSLESSIIVDRDFICNVVSFFD